MHVLLIGSGGREHAIATALKKSSRLTRLTVAPGNAGIARIADLAPLDVSDHAAVITFCKANDVGLVFVGPEAPLVAGLVDDLEAVGIKVFGPRKAPAQIEGSKSFTKALCDEAGIPTAAYARFTDEASAKAYVEAKGAPIVIKADGLAAGKGVTVAMTQDEAFAAIEDCFGGAFGVAGAEVVIEECMFGEEASFFVITDGTSIISLGGAQDHKRVGDGDTGPNTGGMGAYSPAPVFTPAIEAEVMEKMIRPAVVTLARRGTPYKGVIFAGLMITDKGPRLIEFNARFGDPETQVILPRLETDLLEIALATVEERLGEIRVSHSDRTALTVVMAASGYPGSYARGSEIKGTEKADSLPGVKVYHAGTALKDGKLVANGGRVLAVTALGSSVKDAQARAYEAVAQIDWIDGFCRRDIGWRAV